MQTRTFTHIEDTIDALTKCVLEEKATNEIFNIGYEAGRCGYKYGQGFKIVPNEYRQGYVYGFRNFNKPSRTLSDINETKTLDELYIRRPELKNDPYIQNSQLLKKDGVLYDVDGKLREGVNLATVNGHKDQDGNGILSDEMTGPQRAVFTLNNNSMSDNREKGFFNVFPPADQATDFGMKIKYLKETIKQQ